MFCLSAKSHTRAPRVVALRSFQLSAALLAVACAGSAAGRSSVDVPDTESRDAEAMQKVTQLQQISKWTRYTRTIDELSYTVEYPDDWSVTESGPTTFFIFFNDATTSEIYTLSLSEALPRRGMSVLYLTSLTGRC